KGYYSPLNYYTNFVQSVQFRFCKLYRSISALSWMPSCAIGQTTLAHPVIRQSMPFSLQSVAWLIGAVDGLNKTRIREIHGFWFHYIFSVYSECFFHLKNYDICSFVGCFT
ncbi:MAG: hypothetical protein RRY80_11625, partial [Lachnospiraceae bacterium]